MGSSGWDDIHLTVHPVRRSEHHTPDATTTTTSITGVATSDGTATISNDDVTTPPPISVRLLIHGGIALEITTTDEVEDGENGGNDSHHDNLHDSDDHRDNNHDDQQEHRHGHGRVVHVYHTSDERSETSPPPSSSSSSGPSVGTPSNSALKILSSGESTRVALALETCRSHALSIIHSCNSLFQHTVQLLTHTFNFQRSLSRHYCLIVSLQNTLARHFHSFHTCLFTNICSLTFVPLSLQRTVVVVHTAHPYCLMTTFILWEQGEMPMSSVVMTRKTNHHPLG